MTSVEIRDTLQIIVALLNILVALIILREKGKNASSPQRKKR